MKPIRETAVGISKEYARGMRAERNRVLMVLNKEYGKHVFDVRLSNFFEVLKDKINGPGRNTKRIRKVVSRKNIKTI